MDLGATKTVIGADHIASLLEGLEPDEPDIRKKVTRCSHQVMFRFGDQGALQSNHAGSSHPDRPIETARIGRLTGNAVPIVEHMRVLQARMFQSNFDYR